MTKLSEVCCTRCFIAKSPKEKCKCKCKGEHHSKGRKEYTVQDLVDELTSCAQEKKP